MSGYATSLVRRMVESSGKSAADISREIGRNSRYISVMLYNRTVPNVNLMARVAKACGYRLVIVGHGETIEL